MAGNRATRREIQIAALLAVYEAAFGDYTDRLSPGEVATVMVLAQDRKQARTVMRYVAGLSVPLIILPTHFSTNARVTSSFVLASASLKRVFWNCISRIGENIEFFVHP